MAIHLQHCFELAAVLSGPSLHGVAREEGLKGGTSEHMPQLITRVIQLVGAAHKSRSSSCKQLSICNVTLKAESRRYVLLHPFCCVYPDDLMKPSLSAMLEFGTVFYLQ